MNFTLTEEQELLRKEARDFLAQEWPSATMREMLEEGKAPTEEFWFKIAKLGWPGLVIAEEFDGLAAETLELAVLMEEMGRRLVPGTFFRPPFSHPPCWRAWGPPRPPKNTSPPSPGAA